MKGICFQSIGVVQYQDLADAAIEETTDAVVQVELAGMCGSDLHPFFGREVGLDPGTVMGHEFVGRIVAVGNDVKQLKVDDRVYAPFSTNCGECFFCNKGLTSRCTASQAIGWRSNGVGLHGGQAEFVRVPNAAATLKKIPEGLSSESALLLGDNFSTGFFCAEMAEIDPNGLTVVIGCGSVGLLSIMAAQYLGARNLIAVDRVPARRELATSLGVTSVAPGAEAIESVMQLSDGRGADSVMELVGLPDAQRLAYEIIRPGGVMSVIGCHSSPSFSFSPTEAYNKNLTYKTGRCSARHYMEKLTRRVLEEQWMIDTMITHRFKPSDCVRAYDVFSNQKDGCIKAAFDFLT